ncbi:MAG TPA: C25 family cysteine peptidase, partial [Bdellovibrionota bacterium]|nr:C25 family cysteine peptidase [Bdellovibrionota bacterium]
LVSNGDGTHKIEIPTFGQLSLPNRPVVPYRALLVGIPCRQIASSSITVLDEETRNDVHLAIGALTEVHDADGNVVQPFSEGVDLQSGQLVEVPGQWATTNGIYPGASVGVGTPSCVSDSDGMLTLELTPVRYDASAHSTREARHVQVRLVYGESLSPAPWVPTEEVQVRLAEDSESLKVGITRSGLHRIPNLSSYGSRFRPENVCLYRNGRAVPYVWEDTDSLIFYGAYEPTRQSAESVYWIARNGDQDCSSSPVSGAPTSSTPASLWTKVHAEVNRLYVPSFPGDDETDRFYWDNTYWIPAAPPTRPNSIAKTLLATLSLEAVNTAATAPAKLRYEVQTLLEDPGHNPDHHVRAYLNGNWIDEFYAEGSVPVIREVEMASALLLEGANRFELQEVGDVNHRYTSSYLNFVDVTYPRTSGWNGVGELLLTFQTSGTAALTGLPPNATIEVWDVTAPRLARKLTGIGADSSGNLRFSAKAGHAYLLSSEASLPGRIWGNTPSRLRALSPTATVYLTHADFRPAAERLAAYRRSQGLRVSVVDVEEVYDEYGNGDVSDRAISSFVQDWGRRLQRDFSLLLFGDTTTDPHNYLGHNSKNYVPTHLHWLWVSETGSDQRLAYGDSPAFNGPIRIGRLPVQTLAEAQRIVDKIVDYEVTDTGENWTKAIALVADKPTLAWEQLFETFTNDLAQSIPDPLTSQVDLLGVLGSAQTRQNVQTRFNGGSLFINFLGHGYYDGWGSGYYADWGNVTPVLTGADVPLLTNIDRLPIVTALNCLNGYYIDSRVSALSETMLRSGAGGAVAYLSSSGLNTAESLTLFGENFYRNVTTESPVSLGHAFSKEKARLGSQVEDAEQLIDTLHLFGDPDLKIPGISPVSTQLPSSVVDLDTTGSGPTEMALGSTSPTSSEPPKTSEGCGRTSASSTLLLVSIFITAVFGRRIRPWPGFAHKAGPSDLL